MLGSWNGAERLAEEGQVEVSARHVHVGEVRRVGLVEVVVTLQRWRAGFADGGEEEASWGEMLVRGGVGEASDEAAEESELEGEVLGFGMF